MRLNNQKSKNLVTTLYFVFIVMFLVLVLSFDSVKAYIGNAKLTYIAIFAFMAFLMFMAHRSWKYFEYDSDGNVLVLINKDILLSEILNFRENRAEFPKHRLLYYKLNNYVLYKSLNLYILSHTNKQKRLRFNVSLVSDKKIKYLRQSLDKIVKKNKQNS